MKIEDFVTDLLHIDDVSKNKLIDLEAGDLAKTYYLSHKSHPDLGAYALSTIQNRIGKVGNTVLRGSSLGEEQIVGRNVNDFEWNAANGSHDPKVLDKFIKDVYSELSLKGNNPLFLSVGAIRWRLAVKDTEMKDVITPVLLFPIRLIRSVKTNPIAIEFIQDDINVNPCLIAKLRQVWGDEVVDSFPHPNGKVTDFDEPVNLEVVDDGTRYFNRVQSYIKEMAGSDEQTLFSFDRDFVAISQYNHDELCMYYDIKRNKEKIYASELVRRVFADSPSEPAPIPESVTPKFILPRDSVQERMIRRVVSGESIIIKGPPGTGKTLTIANMIASLLADNKKVILASQKLAALNEVYNKLPDELRDFVMLLDGESEAQVAKINPTDIKQNFNDFIRKRKKYVSDPTIYTDAEQARREINEAVRTLNDYIRFTYMNDDVVGMDYYDALDLYCHSDMEPVRFADPENVLDTTREEYNTLIHSVETAGKEFDALTDNGKHAILKSPWFPLVGGITEDNAEDAFVAAKKLAQQADEVRAEAETSLSGVVVKLDTIPLRGLIWLLKGEITSDQAMLILRGKAQKEVDAVRVALTDLLALDRTCLRRVPIHGCEDFAEAVEALNGVNADYELKKSEYDVLRANSDIIGLARETSALNSLLALMEQLGEIGARKKEHEDKVATVFSLESTTPERWNAIDAAYDKLSKYQGADKIKPLDFGGKKAYTEVSGYTYLSGVPFGEIINAVIERRAVLDCEKEEAEVSRKMNQIFRRELTKQQLASIFLVLGRATATGEEVATYLYHLTESFNVLDGLLANVNVAKDYQLREAAYAYYVNAKVEALRKALHKLGKKTGACDDADSLKVDELEAFAMGVCSVGEFAYREEMAGKTNDTVIDIMDSIRDGSEELAENAEKLLDGLHAYGKEFFANYYSEYSAKITFGDLAIYAKQANNRNALQSAKRYLEITKNADNVLSLARFFRPFEEEKKAREMSFKDMFIHSFIGLALDAKMKELGADRNGVGNRISHALDQWAVAEAKMDKATLSIVQKECMERINPDDPDFGFLSAERETGGTLRRLFKDHAREILKLKKCFLLSPATTSVLFGRPDFSDFDVVIVDEASQLTPNAVLPLFFRAKQCVLVGDEWQMPPIKHFSSSADKKVVGEDGEETVLEADISALSLALRNEAFPAEQLICHYRSKTESLIAFSQKKYYSYMRTFPAPLPKAPGLGFKDVFVEGGCEGGANLVEAEEAVRQLELHFDTYYGKKKEGVLEESVGVVAFGEKQLSLIESLVAKNKALTEKIEVAKLHFDDLPEKLIFFKTIETVQGQEADHLILSLTYGRNGAGRLVQAFGELNRGKLGQCIFNVAVTRARGSVTLIHSVRAEELSNDTIMYIREYLDIANRFSADGRSQFVSAGDVNKKGFVRQVADFIIEECGIEPERVVLNCGATEGSVRIPIAILDREQSTAKLAIWCETPLNKEYDYLDYNQRYYNILKGRGWNMYRVGIHDWVDNRAAEKENLMKVIRQYVK